MVRVHAWKHDMRIYCSRLVFAWTTFLVACKYALTCKIPRNTRVVFPTRGVASISHACPFHTCGISHAWNMELYTCIILVSITHDMYVHFLPNSVITILLTVESSLKSSYHQVRKNWN